MPNDSFDESVVAQKAMQMRIDIIEMLTAAGSGHPGGSLSAADIVATLYFGGVLRYDPANLKDENRDRFVLSKGHAAPVLYAALAQAGIIEREELKYVRKLGHMLQGHPDALKTPGVEVSTGSLGQGLSIACGMALGLKLDERPSKVYCLMGDGEIQEGQAWEAAMFAAHRKLDNLVAIIDNNGLQIDGRCDDVMSLGDIAAKYRAFGFDVLEINGHDVNEIYKALTTPTCPGKPRAIVAHTHKGQGVSFMEDQAKWHGNAPSQDQGKAACDEIRARGGNCGCR